jgi:hypothetical protein
MAESGPGTREDVLRVLFSQVGTPHSKWALAFEKDGTPVLSDGWGGDLRGFVEVRDHLVGLLRLHGADGHERLLGAAQLGPAKFAYLIDLAARADELPSEAL